MAENLRRVGGEGEYRAQQYLITKGYTIITTNFEVGKGEIDLIARDLEGELVFVEVKYVRTTHYGSAAGKVTPSKLTTIKRVAQYYLALHDMHDTPCRIDVVALDGDTITHHKNCFNVQ